MVQFAEFSADKLSICAEISAGRRVCQIQAENVLVIKLLAPKRRNFCRWDSKANVGEKLPFNKMFCTWAQKFL